MDLSVFTLCVVGAVVVLANILAMRRLARAERAEERAADRAAEAERVVANVELENETLRKKIRMFTGGGPFRAAAAVPNVAEREALHARESEMDRVGWQPQLVGAPPTMSAGERLVDVAKKVSAQIAERERREEAELRKKN